MQTTSPGSKPRKVRIVCISDTHNHAPGEGYTLPKGDVLIHAGDLTNQGSYNELRKAAQWLEKADFKVKIVVAGNHDLSLDADYRLKYDEGWNVKANDVDKCQELMRGIPGLTYLQHEGIDVHLPDDGPSFRVFGSPYSPDRGGQNWAFQYPEEDASDIWSAVPKNIDVLITHTPPAGYCDLSKHWQKGGCPTLAKVVETVRPMLHVCGHCHEGRGAVVLNHESTDMDRVWKWEDPGLGNKKQALFDLTRHNRMTEKTAIVNASVMFRSWGTGSKAFNKPVVVDVMLSVGEPP